VVVLDVFSGCVVVAATFLLLPPLLCFLLSCWGDVSFFFGGWILCVGGEDRWENDSEAAVEDWLDYRIHVNNSVVDGRLVLLLLAKSKPALDANLKGVKNFCWVSEVACISDFNGGYFLLY
jgi:hypothetical protein